ncbi:bacterial transcriptional activator domain-containing protein [Actinomadura sp. DC4]|uniref:AfsR/SARP family transcriptional regulator n=1 Tax=Actinomadura sp. DC4 TaxID=3055069 RepID=UPI0025B09874|nr:bacterial transcriptional activator domain-containing protein [Actinomadura sp. DC4]MDN3359287.1 bacterial transcriptional activator domain-containing protein [Actinomadura sp. DC4]
MLYLFTLLGISILVLGLSRLPALVSSAHSISLPWPVLGRLASAFPGRRGRRCEGPNAPASVVAEVALSPGNEVVRRVDGRPDPSEPIQGWSCAGPIVVDVASAGGVIGVCGAGVVRAALRVLAAPGRHTVVITADCFQELYGDGGRPEHVTVARTLDEAIGLVHAASVERIRAEDDGLPQHDVREVWLCARADAQQARLRSLFAGTAEHGVHAVLLGHWPFGLSLTVDDDGRVLSAPSPGEQLTGSYLTTLPLEMVSTETPSVAEIDLESSPTDPVSSDTDSSPVQAEGADGRPQLMVLGSEGIKVDGIELPGALERRFSWEVVTYLACHPEGATADAIIEELWPDEPLMSARKRFTDAVYYLRKALRAASGQPHGKFVLLRMNRYRLDETQLNVDMWEFESALLASRSAVSEQERLHLLRRAIQLYRGEFVYVGDGLWAEPFRYDLRRKVVGALDEAASLLEADSPGTAITMLEDAGRIMPCAEEADRHIMRIYQRLGRAGDARITYETLKGRLERLGEEPGAETRALLQAILVGGSVS